MHPDYGERFFYIIEDDKGANLPLYKLISTPKNFLDCTQNDSIAPPSLNIRYYIEKKLIPAMDRLFRVIGINTVEIYERCKAHHQKANLNKQLDKSKINYFFEGNRLRREIAEDFSTTENGLLIFSKSENALKASIVI